VAVSNEHNCWVRINQVVAGTLGVTKVSYSLVSELADGYAVYTTNAEPLAIVYACQMPLEARIHMPGVGAAGLLKIHLDRRAGVELGTSGVPASDWPADQYIERELDRARARARVIMRRNAWLFLRRVDVFNRNPRSEWAAGHRTISVASHNGDRPIEERAQ